MVPAEVSSLGLGALARALDPQPGPARQWLRAELAKAQYTGRTSLPQRVVDWLQRHLGSLGSTADRGSAVVSPVVTVVLALLVVALIAYVGPRIRRERRVRAAAGGVLDGSSTPAEVHRARAATALREGRLEVAVVEAFRAMATETTERALLSGAPGQTAHEIGTVLSAAFPGRSDRLAGAADVFDAVRYGRRLPLREQAEDLVRLDAELSAERPVRGRTPRPSPAGAAAGSGSSPEHR